MAKNLQRGLGVLAVFALGGPVIGSLLVLAALSVAAGVTEPSAALVALYMAPFALIVGGVIGSLPAATTGIVMTLVSTRLRNGWAWLIVSGIVGALATLLALRLIDMNDDNGMVIAAGVATATICAFITRRWRPRSLSRPATP